MKERKYYLDILRIFACFCVLVNHTNNLIFQWQVPAYSETWYVSILYFFAVKAAVPIFLMISGALLLGKEETYGEFFKKRFLPPAVAVFAVSLFYFVMFPEYNGAFTVMAFLQRIYTRRMSNALWYMYMYLGLLLMLPILRKMVKWMEEKDYLYLAVLYAVIKGILPMLTRYCGWPSLSEHFPMALLSVYVVYFLMGYYMEHVMPEKRLHAKGACLAGVVFVVAMVLPAWLTVQEYVKNGSFQFFMDDVSRITIMGQTYALFYMVKYLCRRGEKHFSTIFKKVLIQVSECTFGIYLISDYMIGRYEPLYMYCAEHMNRIPAVVIQEICVFATGFMITWILRKIPMIKRIL